MKTKISFASMLAAACLLQPGSPAEAQSPTPKPTPPPSYNIVFKDGKSVASSSFRRSGVNVVATVPVGAAMGEVPYPVDSIAKIDFPEPAQIETSTKLLLQGKVDDALKQIDPIFSYYELFKDVPGNWWAAAALIKLKALQDQHRQTGADALVTEMVQSAPPDSEAARLAAVLQAANVARDGHPEKAIPVYDDAIKSSTDDETLAYAWVNKGASLYALQKFDPALLAYLHQTVFYPDVKLLAPEVLVGTGKCFVHIEHLPDAEKAFNDLIDQYPSTPEAIAAKAELKKLPVPATTPTPAPSATPAADSTIFGQGHPPVSSAAGSTSPAASPAGSPSNP